MPGHRISASTTAIAVLTAVMLVLVAALAMKLVIYFYSESLNVRLDPAHAGLFEEENSRLSHRQPGKVRVILFGDSRVAMWNPAFEQSGYEVINRGVGGDTTAQSLLRLSRDVIALEPDIVVLQLGINDLRAIGVMPEKRNQIIESTQANIAQILEALKTKHIRVVLMTVFPASDPEFLRRFVWSDDIDQAVAEVNNVIRKLAGLEVKVMDCDPQFNHQGKIKPVFAKDTLHLNSQGYEVLNRLLTDELTAFLQADSIKH